MKEDIDFKSGYSDVNGLKMYYEIYQFATQVNAGPIPLVLIHGGGSTINTTFGRIIPFLAINRQIIAVEMQAHGHTNDRNTDLTFEQDADDVAQLLKNLGIRKVDVLGFSNGGQTTIELAISHPEFLNKIIIASAFYKRNAVVPQFWEGFDHATLANMPQPLKEDFLKIDNDEAGLLNMFKKDVQRMKNFKGWTDEQMQTINAPALVINATQDVGSIEHALEMYRVIPDCQLAILPGGHGTYLGALESLENGKWPYNYVTPLIEEFLDAK